MLVDFLIDFLPHFFVLQGTERLAEGRQDLEASGGRHINRQHVVNTVKLWRHQNPDKRSQGREDSWEVQVSS